MDPIGQLKQNTGITDDSLAADLLQRAEGDVELATAIYASSRPSPAAAAPAAKPKHKPLSGGVMTMAQFNKLDDGSDSDEERQDYYAGGSKDSGVQIKDPRKKPDVNKVVESVFDKARNAGARTDEDVQAEAEKPFGGSGYRLGDTNAAGPARPSVVPKAPERLSKVITFYRQGFVVDDGPLRSYKDPNNAVFLRDLEEGYVPQELEAEAAGRELQTQLIDKKHEEYKESEKPKVAAFSGAGHSLSSPSSSTPVAPKATTAFQLNPDAPTISIQVRFHDGTKATAKLNTTHTIMDLRSWIESNKPTPSAYDMLIAFPPKPLTDLSQSVQAAGLAGAAVIQKLR